MGFSGKAVNFIIFELRNMKIFISTVFEINSNEFILMDNHPIIKGWKIGVGNLNDLKTTLVSFSMFAGVGYEIDI